MLYRRLSRLYIRIFTDPMVGAALRFGCGARDGHRGAVAGLYSGFSILDISAFLMPSWKPSDLVLSHPPYYDYIVV
jgi:hypothetical protein